MFKHEARRITALRVCGDQVADDLGSVRRERDGYRAENAGRPRQEQEVAW